jgi:hypothetical protein
MHYLFLLMAITLTSCSIYKRDFDCPPVEGVPCTPVTTLEKMIVETPAGEEAFTGCVPKLVEIENRPSCKNAANTQDAPFQRRIWMSPKNGEAVYIYFEGNSCEVP